MRKPTIGEIVIAGVASGLILVAIAAYAAHGGGGAGGHGQFHGGSGLHGGGPQFHGGGQYHPGYQQSPGQYHSMNQSPETGVSHEANTAASTSHSNAQTQAKEAANTNAKIGNNAGTGAGHVRPGKGIPAQYNHRSDLNTQIAAHPGADHGTWNNATQGRWYSGYWHNYWGDQNWEWYNGFYGFWLGDVFVSESEPGICQYWDGAAWQPWYNSPDTPYYCPY